VREVDALCLVLRSFEDENVPGDTDPLAALEVVELELALADLATLEQQLTKKRSRVAPLDPAIAAGLKAAPAAIEVLEQGTPLYRSSLPAGDREALKPFFLLTDKPTMAVINVGEDELADTHEIVPAVEKQVGAGVDVLAVSVQLEAETARLDPAERVELLEGLGLGQGALVRVAQAAFDILGKWVFLTTGEDESRAWIFRSGAKAPECAGAIHSDLQRGFIKADVIRWDELLEFVSRARTTSFATATCSRSVSTSEPGHERRRAARALAVGPRVVGDTGRDPCRHPGIAVGAAARACDSQGRAQN
jgi:hypothetical protein